MSEDGIVFSAKKTKDKLREKGAYHSKKALALIIKERLEALAGDFKIDKVMDICCGSGNLLSVFDENVKKVGIDIEPDFIEYCKTNIKGDFLRHDALRLRGYSSPYIVGNYPFGLRDKDLAQSAWEYIRDFDEFSDMPSLPDLLDCAFIAKNLQCLTHNGKAVIVSSLGILFRGAKEQKFREWLINKGWIKSIEILEGDFFDDTTIKIAVFCFDRAKTTKDIEVIEGERRASVSYETLKDNDFNLNLPRYLPPSQEELEEERKWDNFNIEESLEETNCLEIQGLEMTLKMNKALELLQDVTNQKALFDPNNTPNHRLIRALEIKLKEWKKLYLPQKQDKPNTPSLFDYEDKE